MDVTPSLLAFLRRLARGGLRNKTGSEDGQATTSPKRPVMEGVDAVAGEAAHVGASTFPIIAEEPPKVVHSHACPKCESESLNRIHREWTEIEQPLETLWTHYDGLIGLKAAVAPGAMRTLVAEGVNGHRIVCVDCGYKGELPEFVTGARGV